MQSKRNVEAALNQAWKEQKVTAEISYICF